MKIILSVALTLVGTWAGGCFVTASATGVVTKEGAALRDALVREASRPVKPAWRPMLLYLAGLHGQSVFPPVGHFKYAYESIGPGYQGGRMFGHIDLTQERLFSANLLRHCGNKLAGSRRNAACRTVVSIIST